MEATRIIAVRHGETAWNVDTRIQGQLDIGLNPTGQWQARRVAQALAGEAIAAVYASDLRRAHETAQAIADAAALPVHPVPGLRERRFGLFEGKTFHEIEKLWPEQASAWRRRVPDWAPPEGGETLLALRDRVEAAVAEAASRHAGDQIVLVAHGGVMDAIYRLATRQAIDAFRSWELPNAAINRLLWTPSGLSLVGWADTGHLEQVSADDAGVA